MLSTSFISYSHLITAIVALFTAATVLFAPKGTRFHKRMGYVFAVSLLLVNITAAFMYNLTGTVNFLHVFIILSFLSLSSGMWAAIRRKSKNWLTRHIAGMNAAALGVWAAGFAELTVRVLPFYLTQNQIITVAIAIGVLAFFVIWLLNQRYMKQQHLYMSK